MRDENAIKPGDFVRMIGGRLVGKVIHVREGFALVDFEGEDDRIRTGVYAVVDLEIHQPSGARGEGDPD